jgi:hypothetical protein
MVCARTATMPHIPFWRGADDRLPDIARARRSRHHHRIGGFIVSIEIIQVIPRPKRNDGQTDFPTIAFRSAVRDLNIDPVESRSVKRAEAAGREG